MKVLTLTNLYPNPLQPHRATFNRQQIRELAQMHEMRVIAPISWTDELSIRLKGGPRLPPGRQATFDGLPVTYPRIWFLPKILRSQYGSFYLRSVRRAVDQAVAAARPDLIFSPWAYPDGWAAVQLGRRHGIPVVIKVHGSDVLLVDQFPDRRAGTQAALREADAVIAVSRDLAAHVVELGADASRVHAIYSGIDSSVYFPGSKIDACNRLGVSPSTPRILFIGNLIPIKGLDVLIKACIRLKEGGWRWEVSIIGDGPLRADLEAQVKAAGMGEHIHFHGSIAHADLPDWYRAADVFVLPSRSEGTPTVLLEAMACHTPFVASRVGGIPEIADQGLSRLVAAGDAEDLSRALARFLSEPRDETFDWPITRTLQDATQDHSRVFAEVVARRAAEPKVLVR